MKLIIATGNMNKVREIRDMLAPFGIEVLAAADCGGMPAVEEDGLTFRDNALKKARVCASALGHAVLADDSGLEVDALHGAPGVFSARYAGEGGNDGRNIVKLLKNLEGIEDRSARFVCAMAVTAPNGAILTEAFGTVEGHIAHEVHGNGGFGYDPVFIPNGYTETFGELPSSIKNTISHRANALRQLTEWFKGQKA